MDWTTSMLNIQLMGNNQHRYFGCSHYSRLWRHSTDLVFGSAMATVIMVCQNNEKGLRSRGCARGLRSDWCKLSETLSLPEQEWMKSAGGKPDLFFFLTCLLVTKHYTLQQQCHTDIVGLTVFSQLFFLSVKYFTWPTHSAILGNERQ